MFYPYQNNRLKVIIGFSFSRKRVSSVFGNGKSTINITNHMFIYVGCSIVYGLIGC